MSFYPVTISYVRTFDCVKTSRWVKEFILHIYMAFVVVQIEGFLEYRMVQASDGGVPSSSLFCVVWN